MYNLQKNNMKVLVLIDIYNIKTTQREYTIYIVSCASILRLILGALVVLYSHYFVHTRWCCHLANTNVTDEPIKSSIYSKCFLTIGLAVSVSLTISLRDSLR